MWSHFQPSDPGASNLVRVVELSELGVDVLRIVAMNENDLSKFSGDLAEPL